MAERRAGFAARSFVPQWGTDVLAGFVNAVVCVPNGLAMGSLAGVSPVSGLYAASIGPLTGSLLTSTHLMIVTTTSAAAVAAGQSVASVPADQREEAIFLLAVLTGVFLVAFALLKAGRLVRYIPFSVMQGFMFGVAAILVLDQFPAMVGYQPESGNSVVALVETFANIDTWEYQATIVGLIALGLVIGVAQTKISNWSNIIALVLPTAAALALGWTAQQQVVDVSPIPTGLPPLSLPDISLLDGQIILGALALAAIITVQASGISSTMKNPDGSKQNFNQDILAQGGANVAVGLLSGIPVGGSVGQSAFNRSAGARTRMALTFCGVWMIVFLLFLGPLIELVPMAVLGALMVYAGFGAMNFLMVRSIARTGWLPMLALIVTLVMTVLVSVQAAVVVGVLLSFVLNVAQTSGDLVVRALQVDDQGRVLEVAAPKRLSNEQVTVLYVYGDLFFAGAKKLEDNLPTVYDTHRPVVVLRLRGQIHAGATLIDVLSSYASKLDEAGGRLFLSGISSDMHRQLERSGRLSGNDDSDDGLTTVHEHHEELGLSTTRAIQAARQWLADRAAEDGDKPRARDPQPFGMRMVPIDENGDLLPLSQAQELPEEILADLPKDDEDDEDSGDGERSAGARRVDDERSADDERRAKAARRADADSGVSTAGQATSPDIGSPPRNREN